MIKTLFVFSDMEFDEASVQHGHTDHIEVKQKFAEAGYPVPKICYWNLRPSGSKPVTRETEGTCLTLGWTQAYGLNLSGELIYCVNDTESCSGPQNLQLNGRSFFVFSK